MTNPEPTIHVNVDVTNPGQFFACCGLLELADRLWPGAEGWFEEGSFCLASDKGREFVVSGVLEPLLDCSAATEQELADAAQLSDEPSASDEDDESGTKDKAIPKTDPVLLGAPINLCLNWWLGLHGVETLFKTWAANATSQQMLRKWRQPLKSRLAEIDREPEQLFSISSRIQGSYGFDSLLGWDRFDIGFSLNEHNALKKLPTRPAVELLGAVGLQTFFPDCDRRTQRVRYATWQVPLLPSVARAAVLGAVPSVLLSRFQTHFVYRGTFKGLDFATPLQGDYHD